MSRRLMIVVVLFGAASGAQARTWTDSTGKHSIEAEFVGVEDGKVQLRKVDGSLIAVPLERLSEADRRHVQSLSVTPPAAAPSKAEAERPSKKPGTAGRATGRSNSSQVKSGREAIERALGQRVNLPPAETALADLVRQLASQQQIAIQLDAKALDNVGISTDVKVTVRDQGVTLEEALNRSLKPLKLTWTIYPELLVITSPEEADHHLEIGVYKILRPLASEDLLRDIGTRIAPQSWDAVGGPASCRAWGGSAVVVSQTSAVHRQIAAQYPAVLRRILPGAAARGKTRLGASLSATVVCEYVETPLNQVVADLSKQSGVALTLDTQALAQIGVGPDAPVTLAMRGVSLESTLTWVLRAFGLTWVPDQTGLKITTPETAESALQPATYDVRDLLMATGGNSDPLVDLITATIAPKRGEPSGGPERSRPPPRVCRFSRPTTCSA